MSQFLRKYGVAAKVRIPMIKAGLRDFAVSADWTPATGDVKVSKDGGNVANITTLPTAVGGTGSALWEFSLSATEMEADEIVVQIVDSATKAVEDQAFSICTGKEFPGVIAVGKAQGGAVGNIQLAAATAFADDIPNGSVIQLHGGTGAGQARAGYDFTGATDTLSISPNFTTTPDATTLYTHLATPPASTNAAAFPKVDTSYWNGTAVPAEHTAGYPIVTIKDGTGTGELDTASGRVLFTANAGIRKNTALANFMFLMTDSTNHLPATGLTVTATRSLDGAAFAACANAVSEIANGVYKISLATTDVNADTVALKFTATGADQTTIVLATAA